MSDEQKYSTAGSHILLEAIKKGLCAWREEKWTVSKNSQSSSI